MKGFFLALQFLTILPVRIKGGISGENLGRSSVFFPLIGLFKGLLLVLTYKALGPVFSHQIIAALLLILSVLINGGFHLDGLADTFDAIASRKSRERKLDIMKDSTAGPIGITAIVLVLLLKYLLILELLSSNPTPYLLLFPVIGAWSMVPAMLHGSSARRDGLGKTFIDNTGSTESVLSVALTMVIFISITYLFSDFFFLPQVLLPISLIAAIYIFTISLAKFFGSHFGGLTGDNLGAISELSETVFLLIMAGLQGLDILTIYPLFVT